jgi:hypothetical protein
MSIKQSLKNRVALLMVGRQRSHDDAIETLEAKHIDPALPFTNDSSFFYGSDVQGNAFIARMAFRGPSRSLETWFDFYITGKGFVGIKGNPGSEGHGFSIGNLQWEPIIIGKEWLITYQGPMEDRDGNVYEAKVELVFSGNEKVYDFAQSSDRKAIAGAIAREKWTKEFFIRLKELSQVHYEQMGSLTGFITLNGKRHEFTFTALRDHSYGSRNWAQWDRHYWMSGVTEDGTSFTVTTIRYDFLGRLTAGFIVDGEGNVDSIAECTGLDEISKEVLWPENGTVVMKTISGRNIILDFHRHGHFPYFMDNIYHMLEGIGTYTFNGVPARGMIEFGFNSSLHSPLD